MKSKKLLLLLLMAVFAPWAAQAQETLTVCDGGNTNSTVPIYSLYADYGTRSQFIYPADLLEDMAGGTIQNITFYNGTASINFDEGFTVYMLEVDYTTFASTTLVDWSSMAQVYQGSLTVSNNEMSIELDNPFAYEGGNLMIGIQITSWGTVCPSSSWQGESQTGRTGLYNNANSSHTWSSTVNGVNFLPKTTFTYEPAQQGGDVCEKPATLVAENVTDNSAALTWTGGSGVYNIELNGNIIAENYEGYTYNLTDLTATTSYTAKVQSVCDGSTPTSGWKNVSFTTPCGTYDIPYTYGFEDAAPFDCWTPITGVTRASSSSNAHNGSYYLRFAGTTSNLVALPQFNEPTNNLRVEFWTRPEGCTYSSCGTFSVGYMTDITDASTFVEVENYAYNEWTSNTHVKKTVDFNNAPANANIAFRHNAGSTSYYWYADDVTVKAIPSCFAPTDLAVANISTNSADLSWTANSNETQWTVYYKKTADENYTEVANVTENPYTLNGLTAATNYQYYVVANCSTEEASEPSEVFAFTTACDAITNLPWSEDFDAYSATATSSSAPSGYPNDVMPSCWTFVNRSDNSNTYPQAFLTSSSAYAVSGNCLFFKSSSTTPLYAVLPEFAQDIAGLQLTFTYRNEGTGTSNGTLIVGYMTDPTDATTFETVLTCDRTTTKTEMEATFVGAPTGSYIAFMYQGGSSNNYYLSIDNVVVEPAPTCIKPTNFAATNVTNHSATLSWTAGNEGQNLWQIAYSTTSFNPNAADFDLTTVEVIDNVEETSYTFDKTLDANTHYYMYVRGYCGDEDYSKWVGIDFTTSQANPSPTITSVDEITPVSAVLRWTAAGGDYLESYDIYYSMTSGQPANDSLIQYTGVDAGFTSKILQNLTEGYWYVYMRAYHGETDGYSSWTPYYGYGFQVPEACPEPTGLAASDPTPNSITLTWTEGAEWQYAWKVAYSTDPEFNPEEMDPETFVDVFGQQGPTITCTVNGLESETTYYFKVLGNCNSPYGDSDWTDAVSETTLVACPVPTDLNVTVAQTSATLSWTGYSDSYTVQYRTAGGYDSEIFQGFEDGMGEWTMNNCHSNTGMTTSYGDAMFRFYYTSNYPQYLISPLLNGDNGGTMSFQYARYSNSYTEYFKVGYSTTTDDPEEFTWDEEVSVTNLYSTEFLEYTYTIPAGTKYVSIACTSNNEFYLFIDDITIQCGEYNEPGEWMTYGDNVQSGAVTLTGLERGTRYEARVKANCGEEYSGILTFTTGSVKEYEVEGAWGQGANWEPDGAPTIDDDIVIKADVTIPAGVTAYANNITLEGGSITIEDGGQLIHNNEVEVTMNMNVLGWNVAVAPGEETKDGEEYKGGYNLITVPVYDPTLYGTRIYVNSTGLNTGNYDLYSFVATYENAEWRNFKANEFDKFELGEGYLYANEDDVTPSITGTAVSTTSEKSYPLYFAGYEFKGWNLVGNPFTCMAYVNRPYYTMNNTGDGFIAVTGGSVQVMEGIFVVATQANETVTFYPENGDGGEVIGEIGGEPLDKSQLVLNLSNGNNLIDRAIVRFDEGRELPKFQFNENGTQVYITMDNEDYAIVRGEGVGEMPVSFKAEKNGTYNLSFAAEEVSFNYLHLIDNMTGNDVDLLETPSYTFNAQTTDYASRFKLVFATGNNSNEDSFAFFSNGNFVINNEGNATLQVVDVMGRIVKSESINGSATVSVNAATGVYMLRLINGDNVKVQKIVVR